MGNVRNILRIAKQWIFPPGVYNLFFWSYKKHLAALKVPVNIKKSHSLNARFRNTHEGERCFILGSGPSVKKQNLAILEGEHCISMSRFYLHDKYDLIQPKYHVFAPNHHPYKFELPRENLEELERRTNWNQEIFICHTSYKYSYFELMKKQPAYALKNISFINYIASVELTEYNAYDEVIWDISKRPFLIRSALYACIQLALFMGFKEIYLVGVDHDYLAELNEDGSSTHFYQVAEGLNDADFYKDKEKLFFGFYKRWGHYRLMRTYAEKRGQRIFNASEKSYLDVFQRMKLEDVLRNSI